MSISWPDWVFSANSRSAFRACQIDTYGRLCGRITSQGFWLFSDVCSSDVERRFNRFILCWSLPSAELQRHLEILNQNSDSKKYSNNLAPNWNILMFCLDKNVYIPIRRIVFAVEPFLVVLSTFVKNPLLYILAKFSNSSNVQMFRPGLEKDELQAIQQPSQISLSARTSGLETKPVKIQW